MSTEIKMQTKTFVFILYSILEQLFGNYENNVFCFWPIKMLFSPIVQKKKITLGKLWLLLWTSN